MVFWFGLVWFAWRELTAPVAVGRRRASSSSIKAHTGDVKQSHHRNYIQVSTGELFSSALLSLQLLSESSRRLIIIFDENEVVSSVVVCGSGSSGYVRRELGKGCSESTQRRYVQGTYEARRIVLFSGQTEVR